MPRPEPTDVPQATNPPQNPSNGRRGFLKTGSAISAGIAASMVGRVAADEPAQDDQSSPDPQSPDGQAPDAQATEAQPSGRLVRIGLIGAGGRGSGAINDSLTINSNVELVAIADLEGAKLGPLTKSLDRRYEGKIKVDESKMHSGIDGYRRVLDDPDVDLVLFATPPGFRPQYLVEAVEAGKHVFAEKPSCVDPAGYKLCLQAHEKAIENGTCIVTGTQYRRQTNYIEAIKLIHDGAIGEIVSGTARYCSNGIWNRIRKPEMSDTEYQIFNWMHFIWLSGDQIAEQAVHNIDAINWIMGGPPVSAFGGGGRFTRPEGSEMWDSMAIDYVYPGDKVVSFMCRQIPDAASDNSNVIYGTDGTATIYGGNSGATIVDRQGNEIFSMKGNIGAAYKQEHKDLVDAIRAETPIVELKETANSSLTAVLGRMAAYTGKEVTWDFVTGESQLNLFPEDFDIKGSRPKPEFAVPGKTKLT